MIEFEHAPAVPVAYERLKAAFTPSELQEAVRSGYVSREPDPDFGPAGGASFGRDFVVSSHLDDWRNRMLLVWLCFIFENMQNVQRPKAALEEIFSELQGGPNDLDGDLFPLCVMYAGAAAREVRSVAELDDERCVLRPYYENAVRLLADYSGLAQS